MILNKIKNQRAIIIIAGIFFAAGYFIYTDLRSSLIAPPVSDPAVSVFPGPVSASGSKDAATSEPNQSARLVPEDAREYKSSAYDFSLLYPQYLSAAEQAEGGGASTITFQNVEKAEGFQIFIVPYKEAQVSEERFKQDVPTGVREALTNIEVDGVTGAAFYSTNIGLGETYEVWFVHGGFLYEVTTLKPLEAWLGEIIKTWKFIYQ